MSKTIMFHTTLIKAQKKLWELQGAQELQHSGRHLHQCIELITKAKDTFQLWKIWMVLMQKIVKAWLILEDAQELHETAVTQKPMMPGMVECTAALVMCTQGFISMHTEILQLLSWTPVKPNVSLVEEYWGMHDEGLLYWQWDLVEEPLPLI